jgi:hypothetical protein
MNNFYNNKYVTATVSLLIALYISALRHNLNPDALKFLQSPIIRTLLIMTILFTSITSEDPHIIFLVALVMMFTFNYLNENEEKMDLVKFNRNIYSK